MLVRTVWRMVWFEVKVELEGIARRLLQAEDKDDPAQGDSLGNGEK